MDWFAAGLILIGNLILVKYRHWLTFVIFLVGNIIYTVYWVINEQWATCILTGVFILQNIWGIYEWKFKKK